MSRTYHQARRAVGTALLAVLILLPFLRVNGESAFRFDVPSLRLLFFGTAIWMEDFFIILVALLALTFLILFITIAFGRIWCGWLCPQTVLVDLSPFLDRRSSRGALQRSTASLVAAAASLLIGASLIGYFVSPYDALRVIHSGGTAAAVVVGTWAGLSIILFLDLVMVRRTFCATVCPYAKLQGVLFDDRTLIVAFDQERRDECMQCNACVRACPVDIDIREGTQAACIHCAECVDACSGRMALRKRIPLVAYLFGMPGTRKTGPRISLILTGSLTISAVLLFLYLASTRAPFEATVLPVTSGSFAAAAGKGVTNAYTLILRNTGSTDLEASLSVTVPEGSAQVRPDHVRLDRGQEEARIVITITLTGFRADGRRFLPLTLVVKDDSRNKELARPISFLLPDRL